MDKDKLPTFDDRYKKTKSRRYVCEPAISDPGVDFVLPQPDKARVPGQNFLVFSYAAPEGARVKCTKVAVKPSGAFNTEAEANKQAQIIRDEDPRFDVEVLEMYNWVTVPIPQDVKPFLRKEYTNKQMTQVMAGLQQSLKQSKKEMDERMAQDRAKAEAELRKKYGPDYVMAKKSDQVKEYEKNKIEQENKSDGLKFSQRELVDSFAKFIISTKKITPESAAEFLRFFEASQIALSAPNNADVIAVSIPDSSTASTSSI